MEGAFAATDDFAVPTPERPSRREYTVRITPKIRETLDNLANRYNLYTPEGTVRDAEIVRVLLICALTEGWSPREQAIVALYVNGLMLVSQGLWLGFYDVRDDLVDTVRPAIRTSEGIERSKRPGNMPRSPDSERFHVKVDDWIRGRLTAVALATNYTREDGTILDTKLVSALIQHAVDHPDVYRHAFALYARGILQVRQGLSAGLVAIRNSLTSAIATTGETRR